VSKILFVHPRKEGSGLTEVARIEPLVFGYLAAGLDGRHEFSCVDLRVSSDRQMVDAVNSFYPDIVGITAYTVQANEAIEISKKIKTISNDIRVVIGGRHATSLPASFQIPSVDAIARYECEGVINDIADWNLGKVPAMVYRSGSTWVSNGGRPQSVFSRITPLHGLVDQKFYHILGMPAGATQFSRGCVYNCKFCDVASFNGRACQTRPPASVANEIRSMPGEWIFALDDNIGLNKEYLLALAGLFRAQGIEKRFALTMGANEVVRNKDILRQWRKLGLVSVLLGYERLGDENATFGKRTNEQLNDEATAILHANHIIILGSFIVSPTDTKEYFQRLTDYVHARKIEFTMFTVLTPLPGTELWQDEYSSLNFDHFDFAHAVTPTTLEKPVFYSEMAKLWSSYDYWPLVRSLGSIVGPLGMPALIKRLLTARSKVSKFSREIVNAG
jgi:radical SAM superfamily enzyme YgiQ (UPF0313 family)